MAIKVTDRLLANPGPKGKHLVARLKTDHHQTGCETIPAGTKGIATFSKGPKGNTCYFVIPHTALPAAMRLFSDGHLRIVDWNNLEPLGRVG